MISVMETELGLTIYRSGRNPGITRLPSGHPALAAVRALLSHEAPDAVIWARIEQALADPLGWLQNWVGTCGFELDRENPKAPVIKAASSGGTGAPAVISPITCTEEILGYLSRLFAEAGPLRHFLQALSSERLGSQNDTAAWRWSPGTLLAVKKVEGYDMYPLRKVILPVDAIKGKEVDITRAPDSPIAGQWEYGLAIDTGSSPAGRAIRKVVVSGDQFSRDGEALLACAMTAASGATFGVYQGLSSGWAIDESTDSFAYARQVAEEIEAAGGQSRILNHLSGEACPV